MSGWTDLPLSRRGRAQAQLLRERLHREPPAAAIYSSPLHRAVETARISWSPHLGELLLCDDLREIDCGEMDGATIGDVQRLHPALWRRHLEQADPDFRWPGGESYRELRARCLRAVAAIATAHPGDRVVVVTHAGCITQLVGALHGTMPARWSCHRAANCSVSELEWSESGGRLLTFDDRTHLADDGRSRSRG